jgi:AraC-like DNA-binding protein
VISCTVPVRGAIASRGDRGTLKYVTNTLTSTHCSTTNMDPIEEAIAAIESREPGDDIIYQEYATFFNVNRVTLARRHQGRQHSRATQYCNQLKLTPNQEQELVLYIGDLTR